MEIFKNLFFRLNIRKQVFYTITFLLVLFLFLYSKRTDILENFSKLKTTIEIIAGTSKTYLDDELSLIMLTGGRFKEIKDFLNSINLNFVQLISKALTTGIGVGWQNNIGSATTVHNSFLLISFLGGLPWLIICLKIIHKSLITCLKENNIEFKNYNFSFESPALISLSLGIDAFFSSNFATSIFALLLFSFPLSFSIKKST